MSTSEDVDGKLPSLLSSFPVVSGARGLHESDEFRMYAFKIKRCSKTRSHDWTECPYAHRGEKARRRDLRKHRYVGVACAEFRHAGECSKGQHCQFAHGVFEFWLHPTRYRTRACKAGVHCKRRVCFFAHTPEQLREGERFEWFCECWAAAAPVDGRLVVVEGEERFQVGEMEDAVGDILEGVTRLNVSEEEEMRKGGLVGGDFSDLPDIGWICELVS